MAKYRDWLKAEQTNINPAGTPVIVRPSETVGAGYAALTMRNEQIRNTPETARGGYSALAPGAVPQYQQNALSGYTEKNGYASLAPATAATPATESAPSFANLDDASKARMKQNNPALYNQLLVQGIISPLAEDQKQTATAPANEKKTATATAPATVQNTDAGSPSTVETEPTGYAKYLAQHPELAEADRRAEAEYARSLPTYGALAEQMAQAGIHGGYSDYLQGVAYAKMQDAKQQNEEAARTGYAALANGGANGASTGLYGLLTGGSYTDENGNVVQGYDLLGLSDEEYEANKPVLKAHLSQTYSPEHIDEAFASVEKTRKAQADANKGQASKLLTNYASKSVSEDDVLRAFGYDPETVEDKADAIHFALDMAVRDNLISPEQRSEALKSNLSIYKTDFDGEGWKEKGDDIYKSVTTAIEDGLTEGDLNAVIADAVAKMGVKKISYVNPEMDIHADLRITLENGVTLKADSNGKASKAVTNALNKDYGNLPLAIYEDKLYYQPYSNGEWHILKTKVGSPGTTAQGDNYFGTIARIMMLNKESVGKRPANKDAEWDILTGKITVIPRS